MSRGLLAILILAAIVAGAAIAIQRFEISSLRLETDHLRQQLQAAQTHAVDVDARQAPSPTHADPPIPDRSDEDLRQLLKLRNEVTRLREGQERLKQLEAENARLKTEKAAQDRDLASEGGRRSRPAFFPGAPTTRTAWIGLTLTVGAGGAVLVSGIAPESPAARAQLQQGDSITKIDGLAVTNLVQVRDSIAIRQPGQQTWLEILRDGQLQQILVTPEAPPKELSNP